MWYNLTIEKRIMNNLMNSITTSLIDQNLTSSEDLQMHILNNSQVKSISYIQNNLIKCDEFLISVAFITKSGITMLKAILTELEQNNIPGKIITGDYLGFTEPDALRELNQFRNIEVKMLPDVNLHAKGYFFKINDIWKVIIGSSNLTQNALTTNKELNIQISTSINGKLCNQIISEFKQNFNLAYNLNDVIDDYEQNVFQKRLFKPVTYPKNQNNLIKPNEMQINALNKLQHIRDNNQDKALIISATGTGKTILSAFDVQKVNPRKVLFVVHRTEIAKKAMATFKQIMPNKKYGLFTGNNKDYEANFLFATIQTIAKEKYYQQFNFNEFDYIIIDEVHHSGGNTYQTLLKYFKPKFLLGLTATPERTDDFNIYQLFDYNIAYEIRLHQALANNYLTPFHYFGILDLIDEQTQKLTINHLTADARINHVLEKSIYYGHDGPTLHSLIFISNVKEALVFEEKLLMLGINAKALTGKSSQAEREHAIKEFEQGKINYLITVDIFNEGIDIPKVNQVIFLRKTESAIVYIQQLGRGLRLHPDKEYITVLDFIGNYKTDFLIPTALSENTSYEKNDMLNFIAHGTSFMPAACTINFEQIAKEKIFKNIAKVTINSILNIKNDYLKLQKRLNREPLFNDFYQYKLISPTVILNNASFKSNLDVINKFSDQQVLLPENENNALQFICKYFSPAKRIHDIEILNQLANGPKSLIELNSIIEEKYQLENQIENTKHAISLLSITTSKGIFKSYNPLIILSGNKYSLTFKTNKYFADLITYNTNYYLDNFNHTDSLILHKLYNRFEISKLLSIKQELGEIQGYKFDHEKKICIAFLNFDDLSAFTSYDNEIINNNIIRWFSTNNRYLTKNGRITNEGKMARHEYKIHIMGRKNASKEYFYLGVVDQIVSAKEITIAKDGKDNIPIVEFLFKLEHELTDEIYQYFTEDEINEKIND